MQILLNGETRTVDDAITLATLVEQLDLSGKRIAIEVNGELVPRSEHADHRIAAGDRVEIVQAIGGG
ncbi:MAG: sulfur carrier protein ThiS [Gammaproteobacteria bacterium]|nr:MAG: sulfur carrier protein ThiS [Gammaproteobacteria bacterium]